MPKSQVSCPLESWVRQHQRPGPGLPALSVVSAESVPIIVLVPTADVGFFCVFVHVNSLGVLLEIRNIVGCMPPFENGIRGRGLLFPLPEDVSPQRVGELSGQHSPSSRTRR